MKQKWAVSDTMYNRNNAIFYSMDKWDHVEPLGKNKIFNLPLVNNVIN
jgi:hypothetical protein